MASRDRKVGLKALRLSSDQDLDLKMGLKAVQNNNQNQGPKSSTKVNESSQNLNSLQ
jgi:hypothetical protein